MVCRLFAAVEGDDGFGFLERQAGGVGHGLLCRSAAGKLDRPAHSDLATNVIGQPDHIAPQRVETRPAFVHGVDHAVAGFGYFALR